MSLDLQFYRELEVAIGARLEQYAGEVVTGKATSFEDYRHRVGRLRGLQEALDVAKEVNIRILGVEKERKEK